MPECAHQRTRSQKIAARREKSWDGAGEALRPRHFWKFYFVIPTTYVRWPILVLDALLDVSLDTASRRMGLESRSCALRKPVKNWR
jgi:hypothetical protein